MRKLKREMVKTLLLIPLAIGIANGAEGQPTPKTMDSATRAAYTRTSRLRADMVHPEKFLVQHVQAINDDTCIVYRIGDHLAAVRYSSDSEHNVAPDDCLKTGRDVTENVKQLLNKEKLPATYSVSELTARLAYHWADEIMRYEAMHYDGDSDDAVADELKREMSEHTAFLTGKGDKTIMFMLDMAMGAAFIHRSKVRVALLTDQDRIPKNIPTSIPCALRIQGGAKAYTVPVSLSAECEMADDKPEAGEKDSKSDR